MHHRGVSGNRDPQDFIAIPGGHIDQNYRSVVRKNAGQRLLPGESVKQAMADDRFVCLRPGQLSETTRKAGEARGRTAVVFQGSLVQYLDERWK